MNYCDKCNCISNLTCCPFCGNDAVRKAENNDFCFLTQTDAMSGKMTEDIFKQENIPCALTPSGNGIRTAFGMKLENFKIYVPFEYYDRACEILNGFSDKLCDDLRKVLTENIHKLNISARVEKKTRKKLRSPDETDLVSCLADIILNAENIEDKGRITSCVKGGRYIFVYGENVTVVLNSVTYEIISVSPKS